MNKFGVEPFDVGYGAAFEAGLKTPQDVECEIVEDGGEFTVHDPIVTGPPDGLAFVDGSMASEARLTRLEDDGTVSPGLVGSWAAGAVLAHGPDPLKIDHVTSGRVAIICGGDPIDLPDQPAGWTWAGEAVHGDMDDARHRLARLMRNAEGVLAEKLASNGWLTVLDGTLSQVRRSQTTPVIGYVKTHHRRMLAQDAWVRVPELATGQRSSIFAVNPETYGCYLRVGNTGPWASPWAGIVRLEVPAQVGEGEGQKALDQAAAWIPRYASAPHRDPRAPVNLTPIIGLERVLRRRNGNPALALRAVRAAILQLNDQTP